MNKLFDIAADLDTPVSAYLKLAPLGPRFLLESVEHGERVGRYSFIGFGGGLDVSLSGNTIRVGSNEIDFNPGIGAAMGALRSALDEAPSPRPVTSEVPFHGGLVGAIDFDLAFRAPGVGDNPEAKGQARFYAPKSLLAFDHLSRRAALLHDGSETERQELRSRVVNLLGGALEPRNGKTNRFTEATGSMEKSEFIEAVERTKKHIEEGDVYQLVLSVGFEGIADVDPFDVYRGLRLLNPSPYMYFVDFGDTQIVGSSPEALVRLSGDQAELRPIAGTRPRSEDEAHDRRAERELLADEKEAAEHVMLVDLARNDLGRVAKPGTIEVDPYRAIERYSHVMHLVSGVRGSLEAELDAFDLFAASFPAGTVVGAPKVRALQLLGEMEPTRRGYYAGTVGYFGHGGTMDQAITIRTIVMEGDRYRFQAGAGIVADSDPATEWNEILSKSGAMRSAIEMAAGGLS